jgi:RND superfamily putative drug exporter
MLDMYMSDDRKITKLNLTMTVNPYSQEAMDVAEEINETIKETIKNTQFEDWTYGVGEVASSNNDMDKIASNDFKRAITFMLAGIGIMLLFLFRSFWMTLFVILSLVASYFVSLTISEFVFIDLLGQPGLSWTVPFFSFIAIISLGVDYSIFLIMRYKEYQLHKPTVAILEAMKQIGSVILSAMIILTGTFAALYPSEVTTLMQIATIVIVGLILLVLIMLPIFIPAMVSLKERFTKKTQMFRSKSKKSPDVPDVF